MTDLERRVARDLAAGGRVLLSRLQHLGDVVLTLPAAYAIKTRYPNAGIDYLTRSAGADILAGERVFDRVFRVPAKEEGLGAVGRLVGDMRRRGYAAAVDFYSNPRSALLTRLSGASLRIGGDRRVRRLLYTHPVTVPSSVRSAIDHHLCHVRPLGVEAAATRPVLTIREMERERALQRLRDAGVDPTVERVVGLHPGGKWDVKRWPVDHFADVARRLIDRHGIRVVILAGPGEEPYREALQSRLGAGASSLPDLPLRETAAVLASLGGVVVSDGGIMHVSVAVGTPTVGLFGSSEPDIWFPYQPFGPFVPAYAPIECRPCHRHTCDHLSCLRGLTAAVVEEKLLAVMTAAGRVGDTVLRRAPGASDVH